MTLYYIGVHMKYKATKFHKATNGGLQLRISSEMEAEAAKLGMGAGTDVLVTLDRKKKRFLICPLEQAINSGVVTYPIGKKKPRKKTSKSKSHSRK